MSENKLKPCPFCGVIPELAKHYKEDMWQMIHRCKVIGPIMIEWRSGIDGAAKVWNNRADSARIAELEAELAEKDKHIERLSKYICRGCDSTDAGTFGTDHSNGKGCAACPFNYPREVHL